MRKVHCHSQEYWAIGRMICPCGTAYTKQSVGEQRLQERPSGPVDILRLRCDHCRREDEVEFDISSFFGKPDALAFPQILGDRERVWKMYIWHELRMEAVVKYLADLATDRDTDGIDYVIDAARHFLEQARAAQSAKPN